jgi:predicted nucleic acid-binding protein
LYKMKSLVIDTSALLAVLLNEPVRPALIRATEGYSLVGAPSLSWEIGNALVAGVRRKRLSVIDLRQAWASYQAVPIRLAHIDAGRALDLALGAGLYAYDGYVLETAHAERLPLLTLDLSLARAARRMGLRVKEVEDEGL